MWSNGEADNRLCLNYSAHSDHHFRNKIFIILSGSVSGARRSTAQPDVKRIAQQDLNPMILIYPGISDRRHRICPGRRQSLWCGNEARGKPVAAKHPLAILLTKRVFKKIAPQKVKKIFAQTLIVF